MKKLGILIFLTLYLISGSFSIISGEGFNQLPVVYAATPENEDMVKEIGDLISSSQGPVASIVQPKEGDSSTKGDEITVTNGKGEAAEDILDIMIEEPPALVTSTSKNQNILEEIEDLISSSQGPVASITQLIDVPGLMGIYTIELTRAVYEDWTKGVAVVAVPLLLILLLITNESIRRDYSRSRPLENVGKMIDVVIVPLFIVFGMIVGLKIIEVL